MFFKIHFFDICTCEHHLLWDIWIFPFVGLVQYYSISSMSSKHTSEPWLPSSLITSPWKPIMANTLSCSYLPLWLTSLSRYESTDSVSFSRATLHFPLEWRREKRCGGRRRWNTGSDTCRGRVVDSPDRTWCAWRGDSRTAETGRALCVEADASVCLSAPPPPGSPSLPPAPLWDERRPPRLKCFADIETKAPNCRGQAEGGRPR